MAGSPQHATLVATVVTTIMLDYDYHVVEVVNVDGAAAVYFTLNGTTPTVLGTGMEVLPAAICSVILPRAGSAAQGATVVKLISSGTPKVSVAGCKK